MKVSKSFFKFTTLALLGLSSICLTACNKPKALVAPVASAEPVVDNTVDYSAPVSVDPFVPSAPNVFISKTLVDKSILNDWQAKGVVVAGGSVYVSASDTTGLSKKGTILKISSDGKTIKDLGSSWGTLRHPMDKTVEGVAISGSNLIAADSAGKMYIIDSAKGSIKVIKTEASKDVAAGGGSVFVSNGSTVARTDTSASSRNAISGVTATGGIGSDIMGNVFAVSGNTIKKADTSGQVMDVVSSDLGAPIDVAVDNRNNDLYVLEQSEIKRFNSNGQLLVKFPNSASKPSAIAVDENGAVYVADTGSSSKDSQIVKFAAAVDAVSQNMSMSNSFNSSSVVDNYGYSAGSSNQSTQAYSAYSAKKK